MANVILDRYGHVDTPTLILQNKNFDNLGKIFKFTDLQFTENFNAANETSFSVHKSLKKEENYLWDKIVDFKVLYIPEFQEKFEITVSLADDDHLVKSVIGKSLCEAELSQIILRDIEINTEKDITNLDYDANFPTLLYRDMDDWESEDWSDPKYADWNEYAKRKHLKKASLLHRLLEKAPHYSIGHVDDSLKNLKRVAEFSISETDIYSELTGEIAEEYNCVFIFDSMNRTINVYDLYNTCKNCGYRGDFTDSCPECQSTDYGGAYGEETTILISKDNFANSITLETNADSLKNCFYVEGGDDIINATIRSINPNGSNYFYINTPEVMADMPDTLVTSLNNYDAMYEEYNTTKEISLSAYPDEIDNYNSVVSYVNTKFADNPNIHYTALSDTYIGFPSTTTAMYEAIDLYQFIKTSMLPTIDISGDNITTTMQDIINGFSEGFTTVDGSTVFANEVAVSDVENTLQSYAEDMIGRAARMFYSRVYYELELITDNYSDYDSINNLRTWTGKFKLTKLAATDDNDTNELISDSVSIKIVDNLELYLEQSIYKTISDKDKLKDNDIMSFSMPLSTFKTQITYYSYDELSILSECMRDGQSIIIGADIASGMGDEELEAQYLDFYYDRIDSLESEIHIRSEQVKYIEAVYGYDYITLTGSGILYKTRESITNLLNFKSYLGGLWLIYCSYMREDKYSNPNYISDGLTNSEIIQRTQELISAAKKELYKAAHPQYSFSTDLDNLLVNKDFQVFVPKFAVGNWIRGEIDDVIYRFRLLSYSISFDDIQTIDVEFSTVSKLTTGYSDISDVISSVQSMATSYDAVIQQMDKNTVSNNYIKSWIQDGFKATQTKFVNNADNQNIVIDSNGLLARRLDESSGTFGLCQLKIIYNGLYTTSDGWKSVDAGIGAISYIDPETGNIVNTYGVIAKTVIGKLILGEKLGIYNADASLKFTGDGLVISNGTNTITLNPNGNAFEVKKGNEKQMYIDTDGNITLSQNVNASAVRAGSIKSIESATNKYVEISNGKLIVGLNTTEYGRLDFGTFSELNGIGIINRLETGGYVALGHTETDNGESRVKIDYYVNSSDFNNIEHRFTGTVFVNGNRIVRNNSDYKVYLRYDGTKLVTQVDDTHTGSVFTLGGKNGATLTDDKNLDLSSLTTSIYGQLSYQLSSTAWCNNNFQTLNSDARVKKNFSTLPSVIDTIFDSLVVQQYEYNNIKYKNGIYFGETAQHIAKILDDNGLDSSQYAIIGERNANNDNGETNYINPNEDTYHYIDNDNVVWICVDQIQKLKNRILELENKLIG